MSGLVKHKEPDQDSIFERIFQLGKFSKEEIVDEVLSCLHISFVTLCPVFISCIKELQANPEIAQKLSDALEIQFEMENSNLSLGEEQKCSLKEVRIFLTPLEYNLSLQAGA